MPAFPIPPIIKVFVSSYSTFRKSKWLFGKILVHLCNDCSHLRGNGKATLAEEIQQNISKDHVAQISLSLEFG